MSYKEVTTLITKNHFKYGEPSDVVSKITHKHVKISDDCIAHLKHMEGKFETIWMAQGSMCLVGEVLSVFDGVHKRVLCKVLERADWIKELIIHQKLITSRQRDAGPLFPDNRLRVLRILNQIGLDDVMYELIEQNASSLLYLEACWLPNPQRVLQNLRTFRSTDGDIDIHWHWTREQKYPALIKLDLPKGSCRLWQVQKTTGRIREARNTGIYYYVRSNQMREKAALCAYWCFKGTFSKDVARVIMYMVLAFPSFSWTVDKEYDELRKPKQGWEFFTQKPDFFALLEDLSYREKQLRAEKDQNRIKIQKAEKRLLELDDGILQLQESRKKRALELFQDRI